MHRIGSTVLRAQWNEFGDVSDIVAFVAAQPAHSFEHAGLSDLVASDEKVLQLLQPPRAEPAEYAEWYEAEVRAHQWDPTLERQLLDKQARAEPSAVPDDAESVLVM